MDKGGPRLWRWGIPGEACRGTNTESCLIRQMKTRDLLSDSHTHPALSGCYFPSFQSANVQSSGLRNERERQRGRRSDVATM